MAKKKIINLLNSSILILILISNLFSQHFNVEIDNTGDSSLFIFQDEIQFQAANLNGFKTWFGNGYWHQYLHG